MEKKDELVDRLIRDLKGIQETSGHLSSKAVELENLILNRNVVPVKDSLILVGNTRGTLMKSENTLSKHIASLKSKNP